MKQDESPHPVHVGIFRAQAVVLHSQAIAHLVEQLALRHRGDPGDVTTV